MFDKALSLLAPHHCKSCQKIGKSLCDSCKNNIKDQHPARIEKCIICQKTSSAGLCWHRGFNFNQVYYLNYRQGILKDLINSYKFDLQRDLATPLAEIMAPILPDQQGLCLVPMPTIKTHQRQRGFDHMELLAKQIAKLKNYHYCPVLRRQTNQSQQGLSRSERLQNAKAAFSCQQTLDSEAEYLLLDDIWTTGASCRYAANALLQAGAKKVSVAIFLRQPMTKSGKKPQIMVE